METSVILEETAKKIFVLEENYSERAAQEQAEKKKLDAFGVVAKLTVWNRPKPENVTLVKWERRLEPFWHVSARREIDYVHEALYPVQVTNPHALKINIDDRDFEVTRGAGKARIEIPVKEECHRKTDISLFQSALIREVKPSLLQHHAEKYKVIEKAEMDSPEAVVIERPLAFVLQLIKAKLANESVEAHSIIADTITFEKAHLYFRPVFAFEFAWTAGEKVGVVEVDGLTGEAVGEGEWMRDKVTGVVNRENLFDVGADVASFVHPGAGFAIKLVEKITRPKG